MLFTKLNLQLKGVALYDYAIESCEFVVMLCLSCLLGMLFDMCWKGKNLS